MQYLQAQGAANTSDGASLGGRHTGLPEAGLPGYSHQLLCTAHVPTLCCQDEGLKPQDEFRACGHREQHVCWQS